MVRVGNRVRGSSLTRREFVAGAGATAGLALTAAACGGSSATTASKSGPGGVLNFAESETFTTLNPWDAIEGLGPVSNQIFSRLVYRAPDGTPVPDLAASFTEAADGRSVTFHLRPSLKWQDGTPVLASDFTTMFGYLSDPALQTSVGVNKLKPLMGDVSAVKSPDSSTVVMEFSAPVPYYLDILDAWYLIKITNPGDPTFMTHAPVGTGPFRVSSFSPAQRLSLQAFPGYYAKGEPRLKSINFDVFGSGANLVDDLRSGLVEGVAVSDFSQLRSISGDPSYYVRAIPHGVWIIQVNVSKPPFDKLAVRQALSYSMDRDKFASVGFSGYENPVSTPFYAPTATGYLPDLVHAQAFDLNMARSLLDSAGVKSLTIDYPSPTSQPPVQTVGEIWQADLRTIGVTLNIRPVTQALWLELGEAKLDATTSDVVPWNSDRCLQDGALFWQTQLNFRGGAAPPLTRFGYRNPQLEALVAQGSTEADTAKRTQIYQQLNQMVVRDAYEISFATHSNVNAFASSVHGVAADLNAYMIGAGISV